ncbi:hypothetical protein [Streptomyces sp. NPDC001070]
MTTTYHRAEAARLLAEAEAVYRNGATVGGAAQPQQIAFGEEPADRALRIAGLLTAMAHAHAALAPPPADDGRMWLASHSGFSLGYYTSREAAVEHCESHARHIQGLQEDLQWVPDEDMPEDRMEAATEAADYTVTAIVANRFFDPEAEL